MKQLLQDISNGKTFIVEAPVPAITKNSVLIETKKSLISTGTERMLVQFGQSSYLSKARGQPEKVKMVWEKMGSDGIFPTINAVKSKLKKPIPMGYCNVGVVKNAGSEIDDFSIGDRVVSNGNHADVVKVPKNLCAKIPDDVTDETASFAVLASIGLQGVRLVNPTIGECFVVFGVGLIGLLTVQILKANGCKVLALDVDEKKLSIARQFGVETAKITANFDPISTVMEFSKGHGVDGVLITTTTNSNDPILQSSQMCRKRGRIVLVGVAGLNIRRDYFYEKELTFQVSCSYGPGRYDPTYEEKGYDYPIPFVRWTEQRNFEAVLEMMSNGLIDVAPLVSEQFKFEDAPEAYSLLSKNQDVLGIILNYADDNPEKFETSLQLKSNTFFQAGEKSIGFLGAGNYASATLIPAFKAAGARLDTLITSGGLSGSIYGRKLGFNLASTDFDTLIESESIDTVVIATRHDSHAHYAAECLKAGKHVFVEKPLAINNKELLMVEKAYKDTHKTANGPHLMIGYNRRFAPHVVKMKDLLDAVAAPKIFTITVNAGAVSKDHWVQDKKVGGGRIIGEACHFVDLLRFLAGSPISNVQAMGFDTKVDYDHLNDNISINLGFENGSFGTVLYVSNGSKVFPKERIEVFCNGSILQLDNFRKLRGYQWPGFKKYDLFKQNKGQKECVAAFLDALANGKELISADEIFEVARVMIQLENLVKN